MNRCESCVRAIKKMCSRGSSALIDYQPIEYVWMPGGSYIDTGVSVTGGAIGEMKFNILSGNLGNGGSAKDDTTSKYNRNYFNFWYDSGSSKYIIGMGAGGYNANHPTYNLNTVYTVSYNTPKHTAVINGTNYNFNNYGWTDSQNPPYSRWTWVLHGSTDDSTGAHSGQAGDLIVYYYKLYDHNGVIKLDLQPVIRKSDKTIGMYDSVSGTLFTNAGTSTFISGPNIGAVPNSIYQSMVATYVSNRGKSYTDSTSVMYSFGSSNSTRKYFGSILAPNGCIYGIPTGESRVCKYNPEDDTATFFGSLGTGDLKWHGGVLANNGCIYGIPEHSSSVLKIDPTNDTVTTFGDVGTSQFKWYMGSLAPNGCIYCLPRRANSILKIDPSNDTVTTFGAVETISGTDMWFGGAIAANGCIYGVPARATYILKVDTKNDTITQLGSFGTTSAKYCGAVFAPNGCIYGFPFTGSTSILKIDTKTSPETVTTFGSVTAASYGGGTLAPNGCIYCAPIGQGASAPVLVINTANNTARTISTSMLATNAGSQYLTNFAITDSGYMYAFPANGKNVLRVNPGVDVCNNFSEEVRLSSYINHY